MTAVQELTLSGDVFVGEERLQVVRKDGYLTQIVLKQEPQQDSWGIFSDGVIRRRPEDEEFIPLAIFAGRDD